MNLSLSSLLVILGSRRPSVFQCTQAQTNPWRQVVQVSLPYMNYIQRELCLMRTILSRISVETLVQLLMTYFKVVKNTLTILHLPQTSKANALESNIVIPQYCSAIMLIELTPMRIPVLSYLLECMYNIHAMLQNLH